MKPSLHNVVSLALIGALSACGGGGDGGGPPGPGNRVPASVTFEGGGTAQGTVGSALSGSVVVIVRSSDSQPVSGVTVTFSVTAGTIATSSVQTDGQGRASAGTWTLGTAAGTQTLTAAAGGVSGQLVVTVAAGPAARLELLTNVPTTARAGVAITPAIRARTLDQFNNVRAVAGVTVIASVQTGGGSVTGGAALTDASGVATFSSLAIGGSTGTRVLSFSTTGVPALASSPLQVDPGLASAIELQNVPASVRAGVTVSPAITARLRDQFGNPVSTPPVTVSATVVQGGGSVSGGSATTDGTGTATFATLSVGGLVGDKRLRFVAEQAALTTDPVPLFAGDPSALEVVAQPNSAENTIPFAAPVVVQVTDGFSNPIGGAARQISAELATGGGTLGAATEQSNAAGQATFAGLRLTGVTGARTLRFTSAGLTPATTAPISLAAGPVRSLSFVQPPSASIVTGVPLSQQPVVQLSDTSGNLVRRAGVLVRASLLDMTGEVINDVAASDNAGVVAFQQLTVLPVTAPGSLRLRFSSGGLAALVSGNVTVQPTPASSVRGVAYGGAQRLFVLDAGSSLPLTAIALDGGGQTIPVPIVYTSSNANVARVGTNGTITGVAHGSGWVGAFGSGAPSFRDSVFVTVTRDATGPVVSTSRTTPVPVRQNVASSFDVILDTRGTTIGSATILVGLPPELVNNISWNGVAGTVIGFEIGRAHV